MKEQSMSTESASRVCYETMEAHARSHIQSWLQDLLEAEVTQFLGRGKSQRQAEVAPARLGYRNGYGKPRRVALTAGAVVVRDVRDGGQVMVVPAIPRRL